MKPCAAFPYRIGFLAVWLSTAGACSGTATSPTAPATPPLPGQFSLSGVVTEPPGLALVGATVEIIDGPSAGLSAQSGLDGHFELSAVSGDLRVRANKEGYDPLVQEVPMTRNQVANFELKPATEQADISGSYQLTIDAAANCRPSYFGGGPLPGEARRRTYTAHITQIDAQVTVELSGKEFVQYPPPSTARVDATFSGRRLGQTVTFQLPGDPEDGYGWIERITPTMYLGVGGRLVATVASSNIEGDLDGIMTTFDDRNSITGNCESAWHSFFFEGMPAVRAQTGRR